MLIPCLTLSYIRVLNKEVNWLTKVLLPKL